MDINEKSIEPIRAIIGHECIIVSLSFTRDLDSRTDTLEINTKGKTPFLQPGKLSATVWLYETRREIRFDDFPPLTYYRFVAPTPHVHYYAQPQIESGE